MAKNGRNYFTPAQSARRYYTYGPKSVLKKRRSELLAKASKMTPRSRMNTVAKANARVLGAISSKSSGFVKPKYRVRRKSRKHFNYKNGITLTTEHGGQISDKYSVYLMHNSVPLGTLSYQIGCCLAKRLVEKYFNTDIVNMEQSINAFTTGNLSCDIEYFYTPSWTTMETQLVTNAVSALSVKDFGYDIADKLRTLLSNNPRAVLWKIRLYQKNTPGVNENLTTINLRSIQFDLYVKSSLKFQNRSASTLGTESDEVDNIPLYGKSYDCKGSGFYVSDRVRVAASPNNNYNQFITQQINGLMVTHGQSEPTGSIKEPPQPNYFQNCSKYSKVKVEPGEIKTSVLVFKRRIFLSTLQTALCNIGNSDNAVIHRFGNSRLIALEKIMETHSGFDDPTVSIQVGYELNNYFNINIMENNRPITAQMFIKQ